MNLKGIAYEEEPISLDDGEQHSEKFLKVNPLGAVPAILIDGSPEPLTQSLAILDYFEETTPEPALLPKSPIDRARIRSLAEIAVSDSHPLIVPRVRNYLKEQADFKPDQWKAWQTKFLSDAVKGFESRLANDPRTGTFCHGESVTIADICLSGLMMSCGAFGIEVEGCPTVTRINEEFDKLEAFVKA